MNAVRAAVSRHRILTLVVVLIVLLIVIPWVASLAMSG